MKELFLQWLDDQGLLEIYLLELLASDWCMGLSSPHEFLTTAFPWEDSCNGFAFWSELEDRWFDRYSEIHKKEKIFNERF